MVVALVGQGRAGFHDWPPKTLGGEAWAIDVQAQSMQALWDFRSVVRAAVPGCLTICLDWLWFYSLHILAARAAD